MKPLPLVRASTLRPLLCRLRQNGPSDIPLLRRASHALWGSRGPIPFELGGMLWAEAARAEGAEELGLIVGQQTPIEDIGALGAVVRRASTLGAALAAAIRLDSRFIAGQRIWLSEQRDRLVLHHALPPLRAGWPQVRDFVTSIKIDLLRLAGGPGWRPDALAFPGPAPRHAEQLAALAVGPIHFEAPCAAVVFPRYLLARRLPPSPPIEGEALPSAERSPQDCELRDLLRQLFVVLQRLHSLRIELAAEAAGTSIRSLQRRLAAVGTTFEDLADEVRFETARALLEDTTVRVTDVAVELGYSDSANFTRAFRRWTGLPPSAYRRLAAEGRRAPPPSAPSPSASTR